MDEVDDTQLVMMARKPAAEMFPLLRRPSALSPLLTLVCTLPALLAVLYRSQDESDALWGLRAFELKSASLERQFVDPPTEGAAGALRSQPPLGTWLTTGLLWATRSTNPLFLLAVSYAATAGSVAMFVLVLRTAVSDKVAFWGAILGGFQTGLLVLAGRCGPASLGLFFALAALWGFLSHLERGVRRSGVRLLAGGVSLGACLLAGGPPALGVVLMLLLYVLGLRGQSLSRKKWADPKPIAVWNGWPALKSLFGFVLLGAVAGGWWIMLRYRDDPDFLASWSLGAPDASNLAMPATTSTAGEDSDSVQHWLARALHVLGPMFGLTVFGLLRSSLAAAISNEEHRRRGHMLLLAWVLCSGGGWWILSDQPNSSSFATGQWEALFCLGLAGVGAVCLDDVAARRISMKVMVSVAFVGMLVLVSAGWAEHIPEVIREGGWLLGVLGAALGGVALWKFVDATTDRDLRHRIVLGALIMAHVGTTVVFALRSARQWTADDKALLAFSRNLPSGGQVTDVILLGHPSRVPLRIRLAVRAACPNAVESFADSWETVLTRALDDPNKVSRKILAVDWQSREGRAANLQASGLHVTSTTSLQFFEGVPLRAFLVQRVTQENAAVPQMLDVWPPVVETGGG